MARTALTDCRVIDGNGGTPVEQGVVLINGGKIEAVGGADRIAIPPDAHVVRLAGKTVMPGIFDGHMHITNMPGLINADGHLRENLRAAELLRNCLATGTTTVGHAGGARENLILRDMIDEGSLPGRARLLVSEVVTATGGHVRGQGHDGPWSIRTAVRAAVAVGFNFIKTCATGGFQWAHESLGHPDYSIEELCALTEEAHARGIRVHAHAHARPGLTQAITAGCDCILHGAMIDEESLAAMAEKKLFYMPTLYVTSEHFWGTPGLPAHIADRTRAAAPHHRAGVRKAHAMGIRIATGSDGMSRPGAVLHEFVELVGAGLSPMEAIVAGTRNSAELFGILDHTGTLDPGKSADLIAIDGRPDEDITIMPRPGAITLVMKTGVALRPQPNA